MADDKDDSILTPKQLETILAKIQEKWKGPRSCPICTTDNWTLASHVTSPVRLAGSGGSFQLGGRAYPSMQVVCTNCGFVHHFNLVVLGLYPLSTEPKTSPEAAGKKEAGNG